ncbi:hypothetical protein GALL_145490 [mine drainage metagenome]|uniref:Uncharacterized protein n=1 Tax=mine drainage metagenome TaxID=410659 RepID=A0A1J5SGJ1_9ZZZZ
MGILETITAAVLSNVIVLALVGWLGKNLIATRLTNSVKHEFDAKLETLKSELKDKEEAFKADLKAKEVEITSLRSGAMSAMSSRQIAVDKRRLEAVDQLWEAFISLVPAKNIASSMSTINFEVVAKRAVAEEKLRQFFGILLDGYDQDAINASLAEKAHPFVSPMAWAYFLAYRAIVLQLVMKAKMLKSGIDPTDLLDKGVLVKLLKIALPHHSAFIDQGGKDGFYCLLEELEQALLAEMQNMLTDTDAYKKNVAQALEINKLSSTMMDSANQKNLDGPKTASAQD